MKIKNIFTTSLLALASLALLPSSGRAATTTYANGNLFLGFHAFGSESNDYLVNLGAATQFDGKAPGYTITLGNISTDLSSGSLFGASWATRTDIYWGAIAGDSLNNILWSSKQETVNGTVSTPWQKKSSSTQSGVTSSIDSVGASFTQNTSASFTNSLIEAKSGAESYASWQPGYGNTDGANSNGISFAFFNPTNEANSASGIANTRLDLFKIPNTNATGAGAGTYDGTFSLSSAGVLTFSVVPEPSTYSALIGGAAILVWFMRRRQTTKA